VGFSSSSSGCRFPEDFEAFTICLGPTGTRTLEEAGLGLDLGGIVVAQTQAETETLQSFFPLTKKAIEN
jgi:hypothetical protein